MANYEARLDRLEQRISAAPIRFAWMNPGETELEAATRYVAEHSLNVAPTILLALAKDEAAGRIRFITWKRPEANV